MVKTITRFLLIFITLLAVKPMAFATHQRAGEISYTYISGLTYEFTIVTYTYTPSPADRPQIEVFWGDGTSSEIDRFIKVNMENNISKNVYVTQHTFPAAGTFHVTFEDPNRNAGIVNIPSSVEIPFFIETILIINPFIGGNSSPQLLNPPLDNGCTNVPYYHNPGAYDAEGDSLSYSLINCRGYEGEDIPGYTLPQASNFIAIDPITGDLTWDSPLMAGEYNIAILIEEWRNGVFIGSMVRDMQITIAPCNNEPPMVEVYDTCVIAGARIDLLVHVKDETSTHVTLTATGEPFLLGVSPAQFAEITDSVPYVTHFVWQTTCEHVKSVPYEVLFKAKDNGPQVELVSFKTIRIRVIAPAPENLHAVPEGNLIHLDWSPDSCSNAVGYDVYRRNGSDDFVPDSCQTGLPTEVGYSKIGSTFSWIDTVFTDDGTTKPLYHGNEYCYRVVALFPDGSESIVSDKVCVHIANDAPIIINSDVVTTDKESGEVLVRWLFPPEMDSVAFPPPYEYQLFRISENQENELIYSVNTPENPSDTLFFMDGNLNTSDFDYTYRVAILNSDTVIENSDPATSIFLTVASADKRLALSWTDTQPWNNISYTVYRYNNHTASWDSLAIVAEPYYTDYNLENGKTYCYYIKAEGYYWLPDTIGALYNRSQQECGVPYDNEPPEMPEITISTDCQNVEFNWVFSSDSAATDAVHYYIYYKPTLEGTFTCIDSFDNAEICFPAPCSYSIYASGSEVLVGCYAMQVADSNRNATELTDSVCIDVFECLDYQLPNVFTPNGDGINDIFTPFMPYSGIVKIEMEIYNRWGKRVFRTTDPDILWDGSDETTKQPSSDGVYYYGCKLFVNTLSGEVTYLLNGSITLIR
ncbi:MAG: gliding motility-associated C-terminal domain-containing protein [Bacteroidales bacterium]|nr:gliding motility-associated C-terminal domain-containing protein [Bacteroidales bacterium]